MNDRFTGYHKARLESCPSRFYLACALLVLLMSLLLSASLATETALRKEWQFKSDDRI